MPGWAAIGEGLCLVTITQDFAVAYRRAAVSWPTSEMVPTRLAAAMTEVTGADGVGLSIFGGMGLPVPIGASCEKSVLAERLQFTVGQGPCHDAHRSKQVVEASEPVVAARWPAYHDLLVTQTMFRSVVALPLTGPLAAAATIDLLFHDSQAVTHIDLASIVVLCRPITAALIDADIGCLAAHAPELGQDEHDGGPVWLHNPTAVARHRVMVAVGMLTDHLGVSADDALKLLIAHAYGQSGTTDDAAAALVNGDVPTTAFEFHS